MIVLLPIIADSNGSAQQTSPRLPADGLRGSVVTGAFQPSGVRQVDVAPVAGFRSVVMAGLVKSGIDRAAIGARLSREGKDYV